MVHSDTIHFPRAQIFCSFSLEPFADCFPASSWPWWHSSFSSASSPTFFLFRQLVALVLGICQSRSFSSPFHFHPYTSSFSPVFYSVISCSLLTLCQLTWCVSWKSRMFRIPGPILSVFHLKFDYICANSIFHLGCHTNSQNQLYLLCPEFTALISGFDSMFAGSFVWLSTCFCRDSFDFSSSCSYRAFWRNLS